VKVEKWAKNGEKGQNSQPHKPLTYLKFGITRYYQLHLSLDRVPNQPTAMPPKLFRRGRPLRMRCTTTFDQDGWSFRKSLNNQNGEKGQNSQPLSPGTRPPPQATCPPRQCTLAAPSVSAATTRRRSVLPLRLAPTSAGLEAKLSMRAYAEFVESKLGFQFCTNNLRMLTVHSYEQEIQTGPIKHTIEFWVERVIQRYKKWVKDRVVMQPDIFLGKCCLLECALNDAAVGGRDVRELIDRAPRCRRP